MCLIIAKAQRVFVRQHASAVFSSKRLNHDSSAYIPLIWEPADPKMEDCESEVCSSSHRTCLIL